MKLYALHDKKARALSNFVVERSDAVASRHFQEACLQPNSVLGKYADDFELVSLCAVSQDYDDEFPLEMVAPTEVTVVVTARQVMDLQPKPQQQLELLKEA